MIYGVEKSVKDSHKIFIDERSLDWSVRLWVEQVGRHFWSSLEVKKEIEIFKDNLTPNY
jgi:hypothetical protein